MPRANGRNANMKSTVTSSGNPKYTTMRGMVPSKVQLISLLLALLLVLGHPKHASQGPSGCSPPCSNFSANRDARVTIQTVFAEH
jgi:hypothetical protein